MKNWNKFFFFLETSVVTLLTHGPSTFAEVLRTIICSGQPLRPGPRGTVKTRLFGMTRQTQPKLKTVKCLDFLSLLRPLSHSFLMLGFTFNPRNRFERD